jgi:hypothetical protein
MSTSFCFLRAPIEVELGIAFAVSGFAGCDWMLALCRRATLHVTTHCDRLLRRNCGSQECILEAPYFLC